MTTNESVGFDKFEPLMGFDAPFPRMRYRTKLWDEDELYSHWAKNRLDAGKVLLVEPKYPGLRVIFAKKGDKIEAWFEEAHENRPDLLPELIEKLKALSADFILDGICISESGSPEEILNSKNDSNKLQVKFFDLPYYNKDISDLNLLDRKKELQEFADRHGLEVVGYQKAYDKSSLLKAINDVISGEGVVVKDDSSLYEEGPTESWCSMSLIPTVKVRILGKETLPNGKFKYICGIYE